MEITWHSGIIRSCVRKSPCLQTAYARRDIAVCNAVFFFKKNAIVDGILADLLYDLID